MNRLKPVFFYLFSMFSFGRFLSGKSIFLYNYNQTINEAMLITTSSYFETSGFEARKKIKSIFEKNIPR